MSASELLAPIHMKMQGGSKQEAVLAQFMNFSFNGFLRLEHGSAYSFGSEGSKKILWVSAMM